MILLTFQPKIAWQITWRRLQQRRTIWSQSWRQEDYWMLTFVLILEHSWSTRPSYLPGEEHLCTKERRSFSSWAPSRSSSQFALMRHHWCASWRKRELIETILVIIFFLAFRQWRWWEEKESLQFCRFLSGVYCISSRTVYTERTWSTVSLIGTRKEQEDGMETVMSDVDASWCVLSSTTAPRSFNPGVQSLLDVLCCCHKFIRAKYDERGTLWRSSRCQLEAWCLWQPRNENAWRSLDLFYDACEEGRADCRRAIDAPRCWVDERMASLQERLRWAGRQAQFQTTQHQLGHSLTYLRIDCDWSVVSRNRWRCSRREVSASGLRRVLRTGVWSWRWSGARSAIFAVARQDSAVLSTWKATNGCDGCPEHFFHHESPSPDIENNRPPAPSPPPECLFLISRFSKSPQVTPVNLCWTSPMPRRRLKRSLPHKHPKKLLLDYDDTIRCHLWKTTTRGTWCDLSGPLTRTPCELLGESEDTQSRGRRDRRGHNDGTAEQRRRSSLPPTSHSLKRPRTPLRRFFRLKREIPVPSHAVGEYTLLPYQTTVSEFPEGGNLRGAVR